MHDPITVTGFAIFSVSTEANWKREASKTGEQIKITASKAVKP
jgi:nucleoid DNA-binding protein